MQDPRKRDNRDRMHVQERNLFQNECLNEIWQLLS